MREITTLIFVMILNIDIDADVMENLTTLFKQGCEMFANGKDLISLLIEKIKDLS